MSRALWTAAEAEAVTGGRNTAGWQANGVSIDTRTLAAGELFVAIKGPRFDGHDFVAQAFDRRAAAAMVSRDPADVPAKAPLLVVGDTFQGLNALARAARRRTRARVIAITGSVGKTGTKEMLARILADQGPTTASRASLNNDIGVPLSLARMPADAAYAVFELGMNHPGEIAPLSRLVAPEVAVITTVQPVHSAFFRSVAEIAEAKAEIFQGMRGGAAVLNRDNPFFPSLMEAARIRGVERVLSFGAHPDATARLVEWTAAPEESDVSAVIDGETIRYRLTIPGRHIVMNSLAVLAVVRAVGADLEQAAAALAQVPALPGRGLTHEIPVAGGSCRLIDESYNASPASMRAAIDVLARTPPGPGGRRIAVLGDMLELGGEPARRHAALAGDLRTAGIDLVFTAGTHMAALCEALPEAMRGAHAANAEELLPHVAGALRAGDIVMVKGSLASGMGHIVSALLASDNAPQAANG